MSKIYWPFSTVAHKDIYFSVNLYNFCFTFHLEINVFFAEISCPPRKKVYTPMRKLYSAEICFPPRKKIFTPRRTLFSAEIYFSLRRKVFAPRTFIRGGKHISTEKVFFSE